MVTEKMIEALKPCPFCGGAATHKQFTGNGFTMPRVEYVQVRCEKCRIETEPSQPDCDEDVAISAWNQRAEAALSTDAEPVAYRPSYQQIKDAVQANINRMHDAGESHLMMARWLSSDLDKLYPPQTAPSVAVKPLLWKGPDSMGEYHSLDGLWGYIIRAGHKDGFWLTEVGDYFPSPDEAKAAAQADYEARILSALSAQVQDVAGWQSMKVAPRDGTEIILRVKDGYVSCSWDHLEQEWSAGWIGVGIRDREAIGWMPFSAAPAAKQEGKP